MPHYRLTLFAVFASAILLIALVCPQNALAQDDIPPTESAATDAPAVTDEATATEEPAAAQESVATDAPAQEQASVSEILDQVPEGTDVIVLNEAGQPELLVTQAAADIIVNGDPMWCPAGALPGGAGCTANFASFTALIAELENLTGSDVGAGTIYIDSNYSATGLNPDVGSDIIFDYGAVELTNLVFQGGWDFGSNTVVGTSNLTGIGSLQFQDWGAFGFPGSLTLQDIIMSGGDGLYIGDDSGITTANVTLENVSVTGTNLGTFIGTDGAVTITNSHFDDNFDNGLEVSSGGNITLNNVTADENDGAGALLETCSCLAGNVTISDSEFFENDDIGLGVLSDGNVTIDSVDAIDNDGPGMIIFSGGNVTISDTDTFENDGPGIIVESDGDVTLTGLNSGYNEDIGVGVGASGNVSVADSWIGFNAATGFGTETNGNVTLANSAFFSNADAGAFVTSNGSVNVSNSFFGNCFDVFTCGSQQVGLTVDSLGPVDIYNSQFNLNTSTGLILMSGGDVVLNNVTADGNGFVGAVVLTSGNVQVCGGSYSYNDRFGFTATAGTVFMSEQTLITGNGDLPMDLGPGTTVVPYNCAPKKHVRLEISCQDGQTAVELRLPNGDKLGVPCPMGGPASLDSVAESQLPDSLPDGFNFVSGLDAQAARDDLTVSFILPLPDVEYTILFWNDAAWVELEGIVTVDGMFAVAPVGPGIYVLATK